MTTSENQSESSQKDEKPKIVNLCEDMNFHEHDEKSYEKMKSVQDNKTSSVKKIASLNILLLGLWYL